MSSKLISLQNQLEFLSNLMQSIKDEIRHDLELEYVGKYIRPINKKEQLTTFHTMNNLPMPDFISAMKLDFSEHKYLVVDTELEFNTDYSDIIVKIQKGLRSLWLRVQDIEIVE